MPSKITLILISWAGLFAIERWTESVFTSLDPIHPHLADAIVFGIFGIAIVMGVYDHIRNSDRKKTHSKTLARAFEIMCKGDFEKIGDDYQFCVPYPYKEYLDYERKDKYPTTEEHLAIMNESINDVYGGQFNKFTFVELTKSNEADFIHANEHLKSYKHVASLLNEAKKASISLMELWEQDEFKAAYQKSISKGISSAPNPEFNRLDRNAERTLQELQTSLEILSQQLKDGAIVKGKCELGY